MYGLVFYNAHAYLMSVGCLAKEFTSLYYFVLRLTFFQQ